MHRKLRAGPPNIGTERGAPDRHNKQFVIKRRRTGVIVSKKSNGSLVPSENCRAAGRGARSRGWVQTRKKNCKWRISIMSRLLKSLLSPTSSAPLRARPCLPPGMRFVVILGANRIHVASSTPRYPVNTGQERTKIKYRARICGAFGRAKNSR